MTKEGSRHLILQLLQGTVEQITFVRQGIRWTAYAGDRSVGMQLFYLDDFDRSNALILLAWIRAHGRLPHRETIVEIGANIGTTTIPLLLGTECRLVSIEPVPRNRDLLELNLKQNGLDARVKIIPCAIDDDDKIVKMIVPLHALGGSELLKRQLDNPEREFSSPCENVTVQALRLDKMLEREQIVPAQVEFVWSDTQGSEGAVIRTGAALWQTGVPLWVEIEPHLIARQDNLERFLADAARYFASYIPCSALLAQGVDAPPRPIATLPELVRSVSGTHTDVLLLPREPFSVSVK
ncbi:MAG TPA: FkbM family methyltransferase [Anaerolineae bacterium]